MCIATTWPNLRSNQNKCNIIAVALVYIYYIYRWYMHGIHWYTRGIRWYTLVYAGVRWYTRGIRAVYAWYTRGFCGIRVVYARYTLGICVVYAWYTLVYAHDPPAPKR